METCMLWLTPTSKDKLLRLVGRMACLFKSLSPSIRMKFLIPTWFSLTQTTTHTTNQFKFSPQTTRLVTPSSSRSSTTGSGAWVPTLLATTLLGFTPSRIWLSPTIRVRPTCGTWTANTQAPLPNRTSVRKPLLGPRTGNLEVCTMSGSFPTTSSSSLPWCLPIHIPCTPGITLECY